MWTRLLCQNAGRQTRAEADAWPRATVAGRSLQALARSVARAVHHRTDSPPYLPTIYNNDSQIFQSPGFVVIAPEMIHSARVIPLDGRPHLGKNLRQWLGDTRGRFDGRTLVIETTNFRSDDGVVFQGANPATCKVTERLTRVARRDQLRVHGRGSDDLDPTVDRHDPVDQD